MKNIKLILLLLLFVPSGFVVAQVNFDSYFEAKTLRFDFLHAGNSDTSFIFFEMMRKEPFWGGSQTQTIDTFNYGNYFYKVYDAQSKKLIFSRGFNTLFQEWRTTEEAKNLSCSFYESIVMPYPKNKIKLVIEELDPQHRFKNCFEMNIDPKDYFIATAQNKEYTTTKAVDNGDSKNKVDIVFLPEGYTANEMQKFSNDVKRFSNYLFGCSPFKEHKNSFNIWQVNAPSIDSGTDVPGKEIWKNTVCNSTFYTFDIERYLTTKDIKAVRDLASYVPYDQIYILVNTNKYGGGGIYNHYSICTSDNSLSDFVFVHELGHALTALGDEYYNSDVATEYNYSPDIEPYEPNLTTLANFDTKWKYLVNKDTPIPTPATDEYKNKTGAFEGGGYVSKGVYRPTISCTMKDVRYDAFCPVCKKAIVDMIGFYTK